MRAFEISLNGKKLCVAGIGDDGVLSAIVDWVVNPDRGDLSLSVGGIINSRDEFVHWIRDKALDVNDEIQVRIVESTQPDEPLHRDPNRTGPHARGPNRTSPRSRHIGGIIGPY